MVKWMEGVRAGEQQASGKSPQLCANSDLEISSRVSYQEFVDVKTGTRNLMID